jgi:rubrerythrin
MSDKPSYLGLLNRIAVGETRAGEYFTAWAEATSDADVRAVLVKVAARETEHGASFAKRVDELGYEVRWGAVGEDEQKRLDLVRRTDMTDLEKMMALGFGERYGPTATQADNDASDGLEGLLRDSSIDIQTAELLGRYIAEERDTLRTLSGCYGILCDRAGGSSNDMPTGRLADLEAKVDAVCRGIEELRQIVCAQSMRAAST